MESQPTFAPGEGSIVRRKFARRVVEALEEWGIEPRVQLMVLGLPAEQESLLTRYKSLEGVLPGDFESHFAAIKVVTLTRLVAELLQGSASVHEWMNRPLPAIGNQSPTALITASPRRGLDRVSRVVDLLLAASW